MPSSISSSNERLPDGPWGRTWLLTLVLVVLFAGMIEWRWRSLGHRPSVVDDFDNWCIQREAVSNNDPKTAVVLGISRIQLGFNTETFGQMFPDWKLGFLPVEGKPPLATLRDLADDESFKGVVICEMTPASVPPDQWEMQKGYVEYYHNNWLHDAPAASWFGRGLNTIFNPYKRVAVTPMRRTTRQLSNALQSNLCIVNPQLSLRELVYAAILDDAPDPLYVVAKTDRSRLATFAMADMGKLWTFLSKLIAQEIINAKRNPPTHQLTVEEKAARWLEWTKVYDDCVKKIQSRGGKVVYLYMPISDSTLAGMQREYPRNLYWDRWKEVSPATFVHYIDHPGLRAYDTPDWSHLDAKDTGPFTQSFLKVLQDRGILPR